MAQGRPNVFRLIAASPKLLMERKYVDKQQTLRSHRQSESADLGFIPAHEALRAYNRRSIPGF